MRRIIFKKKEQQKGRLCKRQLCRTVISVLLEPHIIKQSTAMVVNSIYKKELVWDAHNAQHAETLLPLISLIIAKRIPQQPGAPPYLPLHLPRTLQSLNDPEREAYRVLSIGKICRIKNKSAGFLPWHPPLPGWSTYQTHIQQLLTTVPHCLPGCCGCPCLPDPKWLLSFQPQKQLHKLSSFSFSISRIKKKLTTSSSVPFHDSRADSKHLNLIIFNPLA